MVKNFIEHLNTENISIYTPGPEGALAACVRLGRLRALRPSTTLALTYSSCTITVLEWQNLKGSLLLGIKNKLVAKPISGIGVSPQFASSYRFLGVILVPLISMYWQAYYMSYNAPRHNVHQISLVLHARSLVLATLPNNGLSRLFYLISHSLM
jgi:hypothetical protein